MAAETSITRCIVDLKAGEELAAQKLWERYFDRLVRLARRKLENRHAPRRVLNEEDVALSAFKSLCLRAADGQFPILTDRDDLWRLLVVITARKVADQVRAERAQKRGGGKVRGETAFSATVDDELAGIEQVIGDEPTPEFAAEVAEEFERLLDRLGDDTLRSIALWKTDGFTNDEIAAKLNCARRTVIRKIDLIRRYLSED